VSAGAGATVGNDVVDLRDRDARPETLHPRFDARAFHAAERAFVGAGPGANQRRWMLWAAKEAAHKALRQARPEIGFAPRHYQVELDASGAGRVRRGREVVAVRVAVDAERVHAVACRGAARAAIVAVGTLAELGEPEASRAVRALLRRSLAGEEDVVLERRDCVPRLHLGGRAVSVSFSHHGRFVAVACAGSPR